MSYFGDRTPQQELYETACAIQGDYDLTKEEIVAVLIDVLAAVQDPLDSIGERAQAKTNARYK